MSRLRLSGRFVAFTALGFYSASLATGVGQEPFQIRFRTVAEMIVVPVTINRAGPFDFLVDTGTTNSLIDRKLAEELHLPSTGKMILETAQGAAVTPRAHTNSLAIAGATVHDLDICVINPYLGRLRGVRGLLGEDFLRHFDLLIDNQHHLIQFEFSPGLLADRLAGEQLPLSLNGFYEGKPAANRLEVIGHFYELGDKNVKLQLDSGVPRILLFSGPISVGSSVYPVEGIFGSSFADAQTTRFLRLGNKDFRDLTVFVPRGKIPPMDIDGLLPTALFHSVFISHSGKFVILEPSVKPTPARSRSLSLPGTDISDVRSPRTESPE